MKIGILCHSTYGGSGVVAAELGKKLAKRGHQVHFITLGRPFRLSNYHPNIFIHEVTAFHHPLFEVPPYFLTQVNKTVEVMRCYQLDILHAHYAVPHTLGAHLARQIYGRPVPLITTLHGTDTSLVGAHREFFEITRFSLASSDVVTVVSSFLANQTRNIFNYQKDLPVIYNFVDTEIFKPVSPAKKEGSKEALLVHVSNFRPLKRVLDVIKVYQLVRQKKAARLLMIGDGPDMQEAQQLAADFGISDDITFLGKQDNIEHLIAQADVMLFPSCCESFGLAALESLSCGVPVIATSAGGIPEVIEHGKTGFLTGVGDVKEMARLTLLILENHELREKMSVQSRQCALNKFNADQWVVKYEQIYHSVL